LGKPVYYQLDTKSQSSHNGSVLISQKKASQSTILIAEASD